MSKKKTTKGVDLINSRSTAEAKEHRREVHEAVHECKMRGFAHGETVEALRQKFQVTRDMARKYITWYNEDKKAKRTVDFEKKRQLVYDRFEHLYGKAMDLAEVSGDYKQAVEINDKMARFLEAQEKRLTLAAPVESAPGQVAWADRTPAERELLLKLAELQLDRANTSATLEITAVASSEPAAACDTSHSECSR